MDGNRDRQIGFEISAAGVQLRVGLKRCRGTIADYQSQAIANVNSAEPQSDGTGDKQEH